MGLFNWRLKITLVFVNPLSWSNINRIWFGVHVIISVKMVLSVYLITCFSFVTFTLVASNSVTVTEKQFQTAVTSCGYPSPPRKKYKAFIQGIPKSKTYSYFKILPLPTSFTTTLKSTIVLNHDFTKHFWIVFSATADTASFIILKAFNRLVVLPCKLLS